MIVGEYHTQSGKVGAIIRLSPSGTYSYEGVWGAGSGHSKRDMVLYVQRWLKERRGVQTITPFGSNDAHQRAWEVTHTEHKYTRGDGSRHIMVLRDGVTTLVPVAELTLAECEKIIRGH